jgi:sulfur carrier protein
MKVSVNGRWTDTDAPTVAALLESLGITVGRSGVAVALNETVVPRLKWAEARLKGGDKVEIIRAVQGG